MIHKKQSGFVLIVSLIILTAVTIIVIGAMKVSTVDEKMVGSYMDRNRAFQSAEMALRQAIASLQANANVCVDGCIKANGIPGVSDLQNTIPTAWSDTDSSNIVPATDMPVTGKYKINLLPDSFLPTSKSAADCSAYSILGRGIGNNDTTQVVLQTIAFVCSI